MSEVLDPPASAPQAHGEAPIDEAEHEILASIAAGDRVAMERIYLRYFARLANFLRRLGVHADFIEESINDIMIEVWRGSASLGADVSVAVAIMRLAYSRERKRSASTDNTPPGTPALGSEWPELPAVWRLAPKRRHFLPTLPIEERALLHIVGLQPGRSWAARAHVPALRALSADFVIAGIANTTLASAVQAAAALDHGPRPFASVADLVASPDIDVISVTVSVPHHLDVVKTAITAGKHVYCEWPLGNGLAEAQKLARLAKEKGVLGVVGTQACLAPEILYLKQLIADGFVGVTGPFGHLQFVPLTLSGARGNEKAFQTLTVPGDYQTELPADPMVGNVARTYARMAADLRQGTRTAPSFDDAVALHRVIAAIETAAADGKTLDVGCASA